MKKIYFLADAHLGSRATAHGRTQERRLANFLHGIKDKAAAVYLLGDMFDYWYEFRHVVPKGYTRFLGKVSELTDAGVEVHFFTGNHDLWCGDYLSRECGVTVHREPLAVELHGKEFYLAHGDGLGDDSRGFRLLRAMFHSRTLQTLFSTLHPRWSVEMGLSWAHRSRLKRIEQGISVMEDVEQEPLVKYSRKYLQAHPNINYFIYGHRHIELDLQLTDSAQLLVLGDWISQFTYAVFDGVGLKMERFIEGETAL